MRMNWGAWLAAWLAVGVAGAVESSPANGPDRSKFLIGACRYDKEAHTEQHVKDCAEAGFDYLMVIWKGDTQLLDWFEKYHLGAVIWDALPAFWEGKWQQIRDANAADEALKSFAATAHPAAWFIGITDEPPAHQFELCGQIAARIHKYLPDRTPNLCLFPSYAYGGSDTTNETQNCLGAWDFQDYINQYCEKVPIDHILYDFYPYSYRKVDQWFEALRIVADACRRTGRSLWNVGQVNSSVESFVLTKNHLRFQAFSPLAFGSVQIMWACYTPAWWFNNVIDKDGKKTVMYERVKEINHELKCFGDVYMRFRNTQTHFVGFAGTEWEKSIKQKPVSEVNTGWVRGLKAQDGASLLVGEMSNRMGGRGRAVCVFASDDPWDRNPQNHTVTFRVPDQRVAVFGVNGKIDVTAGADGAYSVPLRSNDVILICID